MKLSFSIPSKPSSKPKASQSFNNEGQDRDLPSHEYVTEFDPSKTLTDKPRTFVIPPKPNEWRPYKKMKNIDLPVRSDDPNLRFELETPSLEVPDSSNISYGLNLRQTDKDAAVDDDDRLRAVPTEDFLLQKLKHDLKRLPEDRGFEEFADVPVDGFGAALLAGYGWYEGRGIGKNTKEDVKIVQYQKRTAKEGLGFVSDMHTRRPDGSKTEREREKDIVRDSHSEGLFVGKEVRIVEGIHTGVRGRILEILGGNRIILKLSRSEEKVNVLAKDVVELGSKEEEKCLKKLKEMKIRGGTSSDEKKDGKRSREADKRVACDNGISNGHGNRVEKHKTSQTLWLTSNIRVRVISKDLKGGRLYLKKGKIVDVVGPTTCDISMDESKELIQGVRQDLLETALPRRGGPVLVLYGKHKGIYGNLMEKDLDKETGVVQDADSHALHNVRLEQIAEYIGDPSYIGY